MGPLTIYQDNQSCMALVDRGRSGAERTRHIQIRYFWLKERVDVGEVRVEYLRTEDMYANVLTKPLQGSQFLRERDGLTGWSKETLRNESASEERVHHEEYFRLDHNACKSIRIYFIADILLT